ncbi:MAG: ABC transporter ATP-binding protein [Bacilli bacterium]
MLFGKHLNRFYLKYWYLFLAVILFDALVDVAQLLIPQILGKMITGIDNDIKSGNTTMPYLSNNFSKILIAIAVIAVVIVAGRMGWRFFSAQIGANIERDLRKEMYAHIQTLSLTYYKDKKVGGLLSFFTNDLQTIKQVYTDGLIFMTDVMVLGILAFTLMLQISWQITLCCAAPMLLFIVFGSLVGNGESKRYIKSSDSFEDLSDYTEENLQGFSVIKSFLKEQSRIKGFQVRSEDNRGKTVKYLRFSTWIDTGINLFLTAFVTIMVILASYSLVTADPTWGNNITSVGVLITFTGYYDSLIWPMIAGGMLIDLISRGRGSYKRIAEILDAKADVIDSSIVLNHDHIKGDFSFRNLYFTYPDGATPALKNVSIDIKAGMTVGIIGRTGCGKSTFVSLLPKLYNLPKGMLFIDGDDINSWKKSDLREHIGLVSQDAFLFSGKIKDSIAFSEKNPGQVDLNQVKLAAGFASIDDDIEAFPDKYDTEVGEKGATLSGGQRQRISIARAIYKKPDVLILDDSLSAVDADTEKKILANIHSYRSNLTTFIIAHRISAIENSDLILVLDDGKLIASGNHDSLLITCPLYQTLVKLQELEKEVQ